MSVILTAEQVAAWWNDGDDAVMDKRVRDSHEALRARVAEVETERDKWKIRAVEMLRERDAAEARAHAVLDKGEPDG